LRLVREEYYAAVNAAVDITEPPTPGLKSPIYPSMPPSASSSLANFVLHGLPRSNNPQTSGRDLQTSTTSDVDEFNKKAVTVKPALIAAVQEVIDELETVYDNVAKNARDHIHSEYVASLANSRFVLT
jgi:translation initiation factor eIF-2B subunit beta